MDANPYAPIKNTVGNLLLLFGSVVFVFLGLEFYLWTESVLGRPEPAMLAIASTNTRRVSLESGGFVPSEIVAAAEARQGVLTMPPEWQHRDVTVPGAAHAYYWQGALHVLDENGFRRSTPFPPKRPDVFRVMVVGDSLTYGYGVSEQDTFSALLQKWLSDKYRVEVLNLGVSGYQSEDVLHVVRTFIPKLQPDLVLYAVCLNDFLPSGAGDYNGNQYAFPLPSRVKNFLIAHTRTGAFLNDKYDAALRGLHLRRDFYDDILAGFGDYQRRFARDVAAMNRTITTVGLPPLVALVVNQYPALNGPVHKITEVAENALRKAGADVISTDDFFNRYNNYAMNVSAWEGHPNEVAHYIWANMIYRQVIQRQDLTAFRR